MRSVCCRLYRGDDLLLSLQKLAQENRIAAGVVLCGVGCLTRARLRDASGITVRSVDVPCEIVSITGTVSAARCHVHLALSREDLTTLGGHLMEGCIVNTTCELVIGVLDEWRFDVEQDAQTGYDEILFQEV